MVVRLPGITETASDGQIREPPRLCERHRGLASVHLCDPTGDVGILGDTLRELRERVGRLLEPLQPLIEARKMGPLLWQLPENFHRDDERLAAALEALPEVRNCIEFRHPSWFVPEVIELLRSHEVALVIGDHPERPFQSHERTAGWTYIRLHHGSRGRRGNYSIAELETWKRRIGAWRRQTEVFVYANNDWEAFAVRNAAWLRERLGEPRGVH